MARYILGRSRTLPEKEEAELHPSACNWSGFSRLARRYAPGGPI